MWSTQENILSLEITSIFKPLSASKLLLTANAQLSTHSQSERLISTLLFITTVHWNKVLLPTAQSEGKSSSSQRLVASLSTLYLISKVKPKHLVNHATTLQPYLSTKCNVSWCLLMILLLFLEMFCYNNYVLLCSFCETLCGSVVILETFLF